MQPPSPDQLKRAVELLTNPKIKALEFLDKELQRCHETLRVMNEDRILKWTEDMRVLFLTAVDEMRGD